MNKTHYIRRSHEQGNYEVTPTYSGIGGLQPGEHIVDPGEELVH